MKLPVAILAIGLDLMVTSVLAQSPMSSGFSKSLELQGIKFQVSCPNAGSVNLLQIQPAGRITHREPIHVEIFGTVTGAEIADLNSDGWPEVYVYVNSAGSGSYGSVVGYAVNRGKSVTPIFLPELTDDDTVAKGYRGHDEFAVMEASLARRFPLYEDADTNAYPSGKVRQVHYRLLAGEAGWVLKLDPNLTADR
jgi:hypothetical protein